MRVTVTHTYEVDPEELRASFSRELVVDEIDLTDDVAVVGHVLEAVTERHDAFHEVDVDVDIG